MHPSVKDWTGKQVGRWTVLGYDGQSYWRCRCECGIERRLFTGTLQRGTSKSCGCLRAELASQRSSTHRLSRTAEYKVWAGIKRRCTNPRDKAFAAYGGGGVTICRKWSESFEAFIADMGARPSSAHQIDRIDNSRGYEPGNCRWATRRQQCENKRNSAPLTLDGQTLLIAEWARRTGLKASTIQHRISHGWTARRALTTPAIKGRNQFSA